MHTIINSARKNLIGKSQHKVIYWVPSSMVTFVPHWLYRFLDNQKNTRSQFNVPGLREIHRNLKQEKNFNSREGFFRKSPFCTFFCINPGFGGPWNMFWIFFLFAIFIMLQKKAIGQKQFHARVQKCRFGNFSKFF